MSTRRVLLLVRTGAIRRLVHHQRHRATVVKEVDGNTGVASIVGGSKATIEIWQEVDLGAVDGAGREDTGDLDANIRLGVVADDGGVDDERQEGVLVGRVVLLEEGGGVVVTDGGVGRALGDGSADGSEESKSFELHDGRKRKRDKSQWVGYTWQARWSKRATRVLFWGTVRGMNVG